MARQAVIDPSISAVHEAGHTITAHLVLGLRVHRVALEPGGGGLTELDPLPADLQSVKRALLILAAGGAAQAAVQIPAVNPWSL